MKKNIYENFLVNREEANIDEIQKLLNFSNNLGAETFFYKEPFYKKGDEKKLQEDYKLQKIGFQFFNTENGKIIFEKLRSRIKQIKDLRNLLKKYNDIFFETDIFDIKQFLLNCRYIFNLFPYDQIPIFNEKSFNYIEKILPQIDNIHPFEPTFAIYKDFSPKMDELVTRLEKLEIEKNLLEREIENRYKDLNITFSNPKIILKEDIEKIKLINSDNFDIIEETSLYIKIKLKSTEKLTFIYEEIEDINNEIYFEKIRICRDISVKIRDFKDDILNSFELIGIIDSYLTKIDFAYKIKGVIPEISDSNFTIKNGRNIILEKYIEQQNIKYIPLNIDMDPGVTILTGSNMGGKTCTLKTIAQIAYLVHSGLMIPAEYVKIPLFNGIYISRTSSSSIKEGLSSFGYELISIKPFFENLENNYLFLLDEPASGTNPVEGKSIVKAMADKFSKSNSFAIISTHYDGISEGIKCRKYCIIGFTDENLKKISLYLSKDEDLPLFQLHQFIDHSLIEVFEESEVPKNAINLLKLFKFNRDFIEKCIDNLKYL
ncbi:MAG: MutS-related protein [Exilispira sp.]